MGSLYLKFPGSGDGRRNFLFGILSLNQMTMLLFAVNGVPLMSCFGILSLA